MRNGFIGCLNGGYRRRARDLYVFRTLSEVREHTERWLAGYNEQIPHGTLSDLTPVEERLRRAPKVRRHGWH